MAIWGSILLAGLLGATATPALDVALSGRAIRISDIAVSDRDGELVVAHVPSGSRSLELSMADQEKLLKNRLPGRSLPMRYEQTVRFRAVAEPVGSRQGTCYEMRAAMVAGSYVDQGDVAPVACQAETQGVFLGYDRVAAAPYVASDIAAFSYLGSVHVPAAKPLRAGTEMTLRTISGPVTIDRKVETLQPAHVGGRVFVRTPDGKILSQKVASIAVNRATQGDTP